MRRPSHLLIAAVAIVSIASGCSSPAGVTWTFPPGGGATAAPAAPGTGSPAPAPSSGPVVAADQAIDLEAFDLGFTPGAIEVEAPGRYAVTLKNIGVIQHDVTFPDGTTTGPVDAGASATVEVDVPAAGLAFICSIPGHAAAGMQGTIAVKGSAAAGDSHGGPAPDTGVVKPDPAAPKYELYDATAPKVRDGTHMTSTSSSRKSS